ncbi:MAG: molybdate ABC transporter substrate-binding protein [Bilophila wadsworthia]
MESPQDLQNPKIQSIGYPDKKGAIYGKAAERFLTQSGLRGPLKDKLRMFSTVPQVFSYLTTGELDAGFVNTAVVKAQGKSIGGSIDIQSGYDPIEMVAAVVKGAEKDPEAEAFLTFLQSEADPFTPTGLPHNRESTCSASCCTTRVLFRCGLP